MPFPAQPVCRYYSYQEVFSDWELRPKVSVYMIVIQFTIFLKLYIVYLEKCNLLSTEQTLIKLNMINWIWYCWTLESNHIWKSFVLLLPDSQFVYSRWKMTTRNVFIVWKEEATVYSMELHMDLRPYILLYPYFLNPRSFKYHPVWRAAMVV